MFGFFRRRSNEVLKERLKLTLAYDRAKLPPGVMEQLEEELLQVLRRYFETAGDLQVSVEYRGQHVIMTADLPLR
jgi:cell division topological specificity factor